MADRRSPRIVAFTAAELDACGSQSTVVLAASIHAAQARTFRQLLWRRLALAAALWSLLGLLHIVPPIGIVVGWALFVAAAAAAGIFERRAGQRVLDLLAASAANRGG